MSTPVQRQEYVKHLISTYNVPGEQYAQRIIAIYFFAYKSRRTKYDFEFNFVSLPDVPKSVIIKHDEREKSLIEALRVHKVPEDKVYSLYNLLSRAFLGEEIKSLDQMYAEMRVASTPDKPDFLTDRKAEKNEL
jgi:hypothetical protein